jgi:hypothetical protein
MDPCVTVYQRQGKVLVVPLYRIDGGGYVEKRPVRVLDAGNWQGIGKAVLEALADYQEGLRVPDWNTYVPVAERALGIATEDEFEQGLKGCFFRFEAMEIIVIPDETKPGQGLFPLAEAEFRVPSTTDSQLLGEVIREGLSRAKE